METKPLPRRIGFRKGDPYIKVDEGYARLPGSGYEALHPELQGISPEDYPDIAKLRILADVAPYSREYQRFAARLRAQARDNPELEAEYTQIAEQVRQTKESTLQVARHHFNAPVETLEGTVAHADAAGVALKEYPGRVFRFSSVSSSMADLVAEELGHSKTPGPSRRPQHIFPRAREGPGRRRPARPDRAPLSATAHAAQDGSPFSLRPGRPARKPATLSRRLCLPKAPGLAITARPPGKQSRARPGFV